LSQFQHAYPGSLLASRSITPCPYFRPFFFLYLAPLRQISVFFYSLDPLPPTLFFFDTPCLPLCFPPLLWQLFALETLFYPCAACSSRPFFPFRLEVVSPILFFFGFAFDSCVGLATNVLVFSFAIFSHGRCAVVPTSGTPPSGQTPPFLALFCCFCLLTREVGMEFHLEIYPQGTPYPPTDFFLASPALFLLLRVQVAGLILLPYIFRELSFFQHLIFTIRQMVWPLPRGLHLHIFFYAVPFLPHGKLPFLCVLPSCLKILNAFSPFSRPPSFSCEIFLLSSGFLALLPCRSNERFFVPLETFLEYPHPSPPLATLAKIGFFPPRRLSVFLQVHPYARGAFSFSQCLVFEFVSKLVPLHYPLSE